MIEALEVGAPCNSILGGFVKVKTLHISLQGNRTCQKAKLKLKIALPMPCGIASFVGGLSLI